MPKWFTVTICCLALSLPAGALADNAELIRTAQKDLVALGYDPGNIQGELSTETVVAISKFQAEHDMDVTGQVTPQLVGALKAAINQKDQPATVAATPEQQQLSLQQRQQACLQEKHAAAQERQEKKSGIMRLLSAVSRTSNRFGGGDLARSIGQITSDIYGASATAEDLERVGKDLGLTPDEIEACRNPP